MRHFLNSILLLLTILLPATAMAHNFEVDGIYYKINGKNATVTYRGAYSYSYSNEYTGDVTVPATVTYNGTTYSVTAIGNSAFMGCSGLTSITIPNSVTTIGYEAFYECRGLTSINVPNSVTTIGYEAFYNCSGLTNITIPNSVTTIGNGAFNYTPWYNNQPDGLVYAGLVAYKYKGEMPNGTQITLRNGTLGIAGSAFSGCSGLTSVTIPNSVTSIGECAFQGCSGLTSINIPNSVTAIGECAFQGCSGLTSITIPNSVTAIGNSAFANCSGLTSINIPNSITAIGEYAFYNCSELTSINIPNSITAIGEYAFYNCSELTSINIPNSVTTIGSSAFSGCSGLTSITVASGNTKYDSRNNCNAIIETKSNTLIAGCKNTVIPNSVTVIGARAFYSCSGLTSITIPNSVTSIGGEAFWGCSGLTSVNITDLVAWCNIDYDIISYMDHSSNPCNYAHHLLLNGQEITELIIPNSLTEIKPCAFEGCTYITSVSIPESVEIIGLCAFSGCSLSKVTISNLESWCNIQFDILYSNGLYEYNVFGSNPCCIAGHLYLNETEIKDLVIPNNVTSIGNLAFVGCSGLTSVTIPNSVTAIGEMAFDYCSGLNDVYCYITDPSTISIGYSFSCSSPNNYSSRTLYVPIGVSEAYQANSDWSDYFGSIVEMDATASSIQLDKNVAVVIEGNRLQLTATVMPKNTANKTVAWASSNPAVATVDENGLVTAHSVGTATITASTTDGSNLSASCVVTVKSLSADNAFAMPDSEVLHGEAVVIPVRMNNSEEIMAFQADIYLPEGFTVMADENNEMMVTPSSRLTDDHMLMTERLADGAVRVLCYTPSAQTIEGNEGDLFYITVVAPGDAAGDYAIYLRNSRLTNTDYEELRLPDAGAVLTVKTFIPGDANDSHTVNVTDIVVTAQYVLQRNPSPFVFEAADMNGDGEVTVTDIMLIARLILYPATEAPRHAPAIGGNNDRMSAEGITLATGETRRVSIALDNEADYSAFQLDLTLPAGLEASNIALTDRADSHALDMEKLSNGKVRVLCFSPAIEAIGGNNGALLTFDVTATGNVTGDIAVDGIELVTTDCQTVRPGAFAIAVNNVTAVNELATGKTVTGVEYFNLAGQRVAEPASGVTLVVTTYSDGTRTTAKVIR